MPKSGLSLIILALLIFSASLSFAQQVNVSSPPVYTQRFQNGVQLYQINKFYEAAMEFRRAQENARTQNDWAQAIYWVTLSQLAYSDYGSAIKDMDELESRAPNSIFTRDMAYHRARIYYNQGYFEDALILFNRFSNSITDDSRESKERKAAAFFWMGECLFAMAQFDEAQKFYSWVVSTYPESPKNDVSAYRIDLIKQKKIEAELLALLQWSHEESLRTNEDYQRRLRTYEFTLNSYQRRIAELTGPEQPVRQVVETPPLNGNGVIQNGREEAPPSDPHHEMLLERARTLGTDVQNIIEEIEPGGSM